MATVPFDYPEWAHLPAGSHLPIPRRMLRRGVPRRAVTVDHKFSMTRFVFLALLLAAFSALLALSLVGASHHHRGFEGHDAILVALERNLRSVRGGRDVEGERLLRVNAGWAFHDQGRLEAAATQFELAHRMATADGQVAHKLEALCGLGKTQLQQGLAGLAQDTFLAAERLLKNASAVAADNSSHLVDDEEPFVFQVLRGLGDVERDLGRTEVALSYYEQAMALSGSTSEQAFADADIGEAYGQLGRFDEALEHLLRALRLHKLAGKAPRPSTIKVSAHKLAIARTHVLLAEVRHGQGDVKKAAELYQEALSIQQRPGGLLPGHPELVSAQLGRARARRDLGDLYGALQSMLGVERGVLAGPSESPALSRVQLVKADLLRDAGEYRAAERVARGALQLQQERFDLERPDVAVGHIVLGGILQDLGKFSEAEAQYQLALGVYERTLGPTHPERATVYNALGTLHADRGEYDAAQTDLERCLDIQIAVLGPTGPGVSNTYNNLATVYYRSGNSEKALGLLEDAVATLDRAGVPKGNPERFVYEDNLAAIRGKMSGGVEAVAEAVTEEVTEASS